MFLELREFGSFAISSRCDIASKSGLCSCTGSVTIMAIIL